MREEGLVSTCTVLNCVYNSENQCHAAGINVSFDMDHADCATFSPE